MGKKNFSEWPYLVRSTNVVPLGQKMSNESWKSLTDSLKVHAIFFYDSLFWDELSQFPDKKLIEVLNEKKTRGRKRQKIYQKLYGVKRDNNGRFIFIPKIRNPIPGVVAMSLYVSCHMVNLLVDNPDDQVEGDALTSGVRNQTLFFPPYAKEPLVLADRVLIYPDRRWVPPAMLRPRDYQIVVGTPTELAYEEEQLASLDEDDEFPIVSLFFYHVVFEWANSQENNTIPFWYAKVLDYFWIEIVFPKGIPSQLLQKIELAEDWLPEKMIPVRFFLNCANFTNATMCNRYIGHMKLPTKKD